MGCLVATLVLVGFGLVGFGAPARAQAGASLSLQSDYPYRGRSLTQGRPAATVAAGFDHRSGVYAGASLTAGDELSLVQRVLYAGYARPLPNQAALDVGIARTRAVLQQPERRSFDYTELYAGLLTEHASLRLHYAPDYYETGVRTLYVDAGLTRPAMRGARMFAHAGVLTSVGRRSGARAQPTRYDLSAGLAKQVGDIELSLSWNRAWPRVGAANGRASDDIVFAATYAF